MISLDDLCLATGGQLYGDAAAREFRGISDDPDRVKQGDLFVVGALPECGQDNDIERAVAAGATGLLCEDPPIREAAAITTILVGDARLALEQWAAYVLRQNHPLVIGVVGDLGKTSVCEAISAALGSRQAVFMCARSQGGPYSLAKDLSGLESFHQFAVLELAPDKFNRLEDLVAILQPKVLVFTGPVSSVVANPQALANLTGAMPTRSTLVVRVADRDLLKPTKAAPLNVVTYGESPLPDPSAVQPDVLADNVRSGVDGVTLNLRVGRDGLKDVRLSGLGSPALNAALCALATCVALDFAAKDVLPALTGLEMLGGLRLVSGVSGVALLDAASGAHPKTAVELLEWLGQVKGQFRRRFLILGDLGPRGDDLVDVCHHVGSQAAASVDAIIACDEATAPAVLAACRAGMAREATFLPRQREEAAAFLRSEVGRGDVVMAVSKHANRVTPILGSLILNAAEGSRGVSADGAADLHERVSSERAWLEIDRRALALNAKLIKQQLDTGVKLLAVVRDDGFRHGAVETASTVLRNGAEMLAVTTVQEALDLRQAGFACPIVVVGLIPADSVYEALDADLTVSVYSRVSAELLVRCARKMKTRVKCHIRVANSVRDAGVPMHELVTLVRHLKKTHQIVLDGLFLEFSALHSTSWPAESSRQLQQLVPILRNLSAAGVDIPHIHVAGSAALLSVPGSVISVARIGHLLYGLSPFPTLALPQGLRPALTWKTTVVDFSSEPVRGQSRAGERRMAVIPVGYRDGIARTSRLQASALVSGRRAAITDMVGPDWTYLDVTDAPHACIGSEVVLIGTQGSEQITVEEIATQRNCASADVILSLPSQLPRLYVP